MAEHTSTAAGRLQCVVVTPEATVIDTPADFVALPLFDGECGILPNRSPLIGRLGYGELRISHGNELKRYYVDGGFVQVADNIVSVLSNRALPAESLDQTAAEAQLQAALSKPASGEAELAIRNRLILQARGIRRVAFKA